MQSSFAITIRVYYEDTDSGGVVYYANYLKFMERARTEWLRSIGVEQNELARRDGVMFVVRSANVEFLKPARFNDTLRVTSKITQCRGASMTFAQTVERDDTVLCEAQTLVACLNTETFAPSPFPRALAARLKEVSP